VNATRQIRTTYVWAKVMKAAWHRAVGLPDRASWLETILLTGILAEVAIRLTAPARRLLRPRRPSGTQVMWASATLRLGLRNLGGEQLRDIPQREALMAIALAAPAFRLAVASGEQGIHAMRAAVQALDRLTQPVKSVGARVREAPAKVPAKVPVQVALKLPSTAPEVIRRALRGRERPASAPQHASD
jgi:hypothetical protein